MAHLMALRRLEITSTQPEDSPYPLLYVSGRQLKN